MQIMESSDNTPTSHQRCTASRSEIRPLNDMGHMITTLNAILQQPSIQHKPVSLRRRLRRTSPGTVPLMVPAQTPAAASFPPTLGIFEDAQLRQKETQAEETDSEELLLVEGLPDLMSELRILNHKLDMHNTELEKRRLLKMLPLLRAAMGLQPTNYDLNHDSSKFSNDYLSSPATPSFGGSIGSRSPSPTNRATSDRKDVSSRFYSSVRPQALGRHNDPNQKRGGLLPRRSSDSQTSSDGGVTLYPPSLCSSEASLLRKPSRHRNGKEKGKQRYKKATIFTDSESSI